MLKRIGKIASWVIAGLLVLVVAGLILTKVVPGYGLYFVKSGSMVPTFNPGDLVVTGPIGGTFTGSLAVGKVVTFDTGTEVVTHRVAEIKDGKVITKGDANKAEDTAPVAAAAIKGIYMFRIPYAGFINGFVSNRKGWFLLIIIPTALLVGFIVKDIVKESLKGDKADKVKEDKIRG